MQRIKVLIFTSQLVATGIFLGSRGEARVHILGPLADVQLGVILIGVGLAVSFVALLHKD
jgi:hypothetical protein